MEDKVSKHLPNKSSVGCRTVDGVLGDIPCAGDRRGGSVGAHIIAPRVNWLIVLQRSPSPHRIVVLQGEAQWVDHLVTRLAGLLARELCDLLTHGQLFGEIAILKRDRHEHFEQRSAPVPDVGDGQILIRTILISIDAAMRAWMRGPTYRPQVMPGDIMPAYVLAEVVESKTDGLQKGDLVLGEGLWSTYAVVDGKKMRKAPPYRPLTHMMSVIGIAGLTAYWGLLDVGKPQAGETVVVSAAAGSVGTIVGQIAKIKGCTTVGIAGGPDKCEWLTKELGYDAAVDYKAGDVFGQLKAACPKGIDIYFDNVGGDILEACLFQMRNHGRVVCCGALSQYDTDVPESPKGVPGLVVVKRLRMEGFVVLDYFKRTPEAAQELLGWMGQGKLNIVEDIVEGLENTPQALIGLLEGKNRGKRMVRAAPDPA